MVSKLVVLEQIDPKASTGMFDPQVFKGGNNLRLVSDMTLWRFKMDKGLVPGSLRNRYTDVNAALSHAAQYFAAKSIRIKEVI